MKNKSRNRGGGSADGGRHNRSNVWKAEKRPNNRPSPGGRYPRNDGKNQRPAFGAKVNLREDQVGITEYISKASGFTGVVKSRFSDFHVNEIDLSGAVTQLNDLSIPQPPKDPNLMTGIQVDEAQLELASTLTDDVWEKISTMAAAALHRKCSVAPIEIDVSNLNKEQRTKIHRIMKKLYEGQLVSATISARETAPNKTTAAVAPEDKTAEEVPKRTVIKISMAKEGRRQERRGWPYPGDYVHFLVHKENMDTSEVATAIADRMHMRPSSVNYCGTKDKRAKTTQQFCVKRRDPRQIVGSVKFIRNAHVGNFKFSNEVLKLGDLKGNRFRIALRHVSGDLSEMEKALTDMRDRGFINYFGLQRFGNCAAIPTYEIGVALLKCDYKLAVELILKPRENDMEFMNKIRETWWSNRNSAEAAAMFRYNDYIEKKLLDGLAEYGENDYAGALRKIPRNMLLLYPHAFQSLVFNTIASRRIKEFGLQPIVGDLVYRNKDELDSGEEFPIEDEEEEGNENEDKASASNTEENDTEEKVSTENKTEEKATPSKTEEKNEADTSQANIEEGSIFKRKVKALTAEDIASGVYTLLDVVLPLPGYDITYPENVVGSWYEEMLQANDLSSEKLRHRVKTLAMAGAYRKLLVQPTNMSWEFRNYDNAQSTLIESDWEKLKPSMKTKLKVNEENVEKHGEVEMTEEKEKEVPKPPEGKLKALLLDFCLPSSAYATMALRELLKCDTSAASQTQLEKGEQQKVAEQAEKLKEIQKSDDEDNATNKAPTSLVVEKRKSSELNGAATEQQAEETNNTSAEAVEGGAAKRSKSSDSEAKE